MDKTKEKIVYGQFFTKANVWLKDHIKTFILNSKTNIVYDPFAGAGDLLDAVINIGYTKKIGLDIDKKLNWKYNDSLLKIPHIDNAIIVTNPPYFSNYSATRKKLSSNFKPYFEKTTYNDIYLLALDKMLEAANYVVAIIPETFINSNYKQKNRLVSLTILEDNPFCDTDTPVLVACFDDKVKSLNKIKVYKNNDFINSLGAIEAMRLVPNKSVKILFNDLTGWLGVRCVDTTNPNDMLKFDFKEKIVYDWDNRIKISSRLLTLVNIDIPLNKRKIFIEECNNILNETRRKTCDIIFSPFKGNMKNGRRRRRMDFLTCRAILEKSYNKTINNIKGGLFEN